MSEEVQIPDRLQKGSVQAAEDILPLVYDELRRLASGRVASLPAGQTLQPTALVHEAWLRLTSGHTQSWRSRRHFYAAAAQAMRHILIERARKKQCLRHGGELSRVDLDEMEIAVPAEDERLLQIDTVLEELAIKAPEKAEIVKLRFFVGLEIKEIADLLQISPRTVIRQWNYAKAWLFDRMTNGGRPER